MTLRLQTRLELFILNVKLKCVWGNNVKYVTPHFFSCSQACELYQCRKNGYKPMLRLLNYDDKTGFRAQRRGF